MVLWPSDALSTTQVDGFESASISGINFKGFGTMVVQLREGGWNKQLRGAAIFGEAHLLGLAGAHEAG